MGPTQQSPYRAVLVGLGNIAWKFDQGEEKGPLLTHASALRQNPRVRLVGGHSPDAPDNKAFQEKLGVQAFSRLNEMLEQCRPHLVSICSPSQHHFEQARICLQAGVPMIWLEKPPVDDLAQLDALEDLRQSKGATIVVNYMRRYCASYQSLRSICQGRELGGLHQVHLTYSHGLMANGSHILDALDYVLGPQAALRLSWLAPGGPPDNPSFCLTAENGVTAWVAGADLPYHNIDISLTFEQGRVSILYGGMKVLMERAVEHELFPGFYRLCPQEGGKAAPAGFEDAFPGALHDLISSHENGTRPLSSLESARRTMALVDDVFKAGSR